MDKSVTGITAAIVILLASETLAGDGCGLPIVHGAAGGVLFVAALETSPYRIVAWRVGSGIAQRVSLDLPGRLLPARSGSGAAAWLASAGASHDVHLFRLTAAGDRKAGGTLHTVGEPVSFSWSGDDWIVVATLDNGRRRIEAFRRAGSQWRAHGRVRADDLCTPRPFGGSRSAIVCGGWRFSTGRSPQTISVDGNRDLADVYSDGRELVELRLEDLTVLTSSDAGAHWRAMPRPWAATSKFTSPPESIGRGGDAPLLGWVAGGRVHIVTFRKSEWITVLDAPAEDVRGLGGPAAVVDHAVVLLGMCYRTRDNAPDSFDAAIVEHGAIRKVVVKVSSPSP
jgi:hypothetical protein